MSGYIAWDIVQKIYNRARPVNMRVNPCHPESVIIDAIIDNRCGEFKFQLIWVCLAQIAAHLIG